MGVIVTRNQPQGLTQVDRRNPITRAMTLAYNPGAAQQNLVNGYAVTPQYGVQAAGPLGVTRRHQSQYDRTFLGANSDLIGGSNTTIVVGYGKTDNTNRASGLFGTNSGARCGVHGPYSDGTVYFDFGGYDSNHRVSVGGQSFEPAVWTFSAGDRGMEIWKNGIFLATNSVPASRATDEDSNLLTLGQQDPTTGSDNVDYYFFYVFRRQFAADEIQSISRSPWQVFKSSPYRFLKPGVAGISRRALYLAA